MNNFLTQISPYLITLAITAICFAINWIKSKSLEKRTITLEKFLHDDKFTYYVICPQCGTEINLSKVKIITQENAEDGEQ